MVRPLRIQCVGAIIGRPQETPHSRRCRQLPSMGALRKLANTQKPLLEERCHEVTEWWQHNSRQAKNTTQACLFWI